ncbi:MAG: hypothetical protein U0X20_22035 [Caldilineaceae bacterium]
MTHSTRSTARQTPPGHRNKSAAGSVFTTSGGIPSYLSERSLIMQYRPTADEIRAIVARGAAKHPALASRWARAAAILQDRGQLLYWNGQEWHCLSSDGQTEYPVSFHGCDCPDAARTKDLVEGVAFCKHRLALLALREICAGHMQSRLIGVYRGSSDYRRLRREPNAGLLITDRGLIVYAAAYEDRAATRLCTVRPTARGIMPAAPADLGAFAAWLANARPLSPAAAAGILFNQLVAAGRSRAEAADAADAELCAAYDAAHE